MPTPKATPESKDQGKALRLFRKRCNVDTETAGIGLGISAKGYQQYESGYSRLKTEDIPRLAEAFGVSPADLSEALGLTDGRSSEDVELNRTELHAALTDRVGARLAGLLIELDDFLADIKVTSANDKAVRRRLIRRAN